MSMLDPGESMDIEALGDLMKSYELSEAGKTLMPGLPVVARLDGKNFSKFTKSLDKPFDARFVEAMDEVCRDLFAEFKPDVVYTQSDEITLGWRPVDPERGEQMAFGGRVQKLVSLLAGRASSKFALEMVARMPAKARSGAVPSMDCRLWQFPTLRLAAACFLWREADAAKNSVSMLASSAFAHKQLDGVSTAERKKMMLDKGIDWTALDPRLKRGSYFFRRKEMRELAPETLAKIPEGRRPPGGMVERSAIIRAQMPPLGSVLNRVECLFEGAEPVEISQEQRMKILPAENSHAPKPRGKSI